jgi:hypothetical protein
MRRVPTGSRRAFAHDRRRDRALGAAQVVVRDDERLEEVPFDSDLRAAASPTPPAPIMRIRMSFTLAPRPASADESR